MVVFECSLVPTASLSFVCVPKREHACVIDLKAGTQQGTDSTASLVLAPLTPPSDVCFVKALEVMSLLQPYRHFSGKQNCGASIFMCIPCCFRVNCAGKFHH